MPKEKSQKAISPGFPKLSKIRTFVYPFLNQWRGKTWLGGRYMMEGRGGEGGRRGGTGLEWVI